MRTALSILLFLSTLGSAAGDVTIAGRVLDEASRPLAGIKVSVEDILMDPSACCGPFRVVQTGADGSFRFDVPSSVYVVGTEPNPSFNPDRRRVDARFSSVTDVLLRPATGAFAFVPDLTPRASLISIGSADVSGMATISGLAGAVDANSTVIFSTLETGHLSTTQAASDGSFSATHFAPAGSFVLIKADPWGHLARRALRELAFGATSGSGLLSSPHPTPNSTNCRVSRPALSLTH